MNISTEQIKELREASGAGVMECRNILVETAGNIEKAMELLKEKGCLKAEKKASRTTNQGLIEAYIHGGRIGAMVELNCETDFVARTDEFKDLAHNIAMQVAAMSPLYLTEEAIPEGEEATPETDCLMSQAFIKDPSICIRELITETIAKTGENIRIGRFIRYELGETGEAIE